MVNRLLVRYGSAMPIRILHVDDEPAHLEITRIYLKKEAKDDFVIVSVLSAKKALKKLEYDDFDVIVSDYKMPAMNGIEFLDAVKRNGKSANIPFILFTGMGGPDVAEKALNMGAEGYVTKRGCPATQCSLLAQVIREQAQRDEKDGFERTKVERYSPDTLSLA